MPTSLPRIQLTLTPSVAHDLEVAARAYPGVARAELVARLMSAGAQSIEAGRGHRREARRRALQQTAGSIGYEPGYLDELRRDWPE